MIDPRRLAFDIDGVIANTMQLFIDIAQEVYDINTIRYDGMTRYDLNDCLDIGPQLVSDIVQRITYGDYACRLDPIPGAVEALNRLRAITPVLLVTARPKLGPIRDWIAQEFGPGPTEIEIIATGSFEAKPGVLTEKGIAWFVDDRLDTCYLLQQHNITPLVYVQPWNRQPHPFLEVDGWRQLELLIDWERPAGRSGANASSDDTLGRVSGKAG